MREEIRLNKRNVNKMTNQLISHLANYYSILLFYFAFWQTPSNFLCSNPSRGTKGSNRSGGWEKGVGVGGEYVQHTIHICIKPGPTNSMILIWFLILRGTRQVRLQHAPHHLETENCCRDWVWILVFIIFCFWSTLRSLCLHHTLVQLANRLQNYNYCF